MRPVKYNDEILKLCVELSGLGLSHSAIASKLDISVNTLRYWRANNNRLKVLMDTAKEQGAIDCIEVGLRKLASGAVDEEHQEKYIEKRVFIDDETGEEIEVPVEVTKKRKVNKPSVQAIEVLSRKYDKEFSKSDIVTHNNLNILEGFTMRDLQESLKTNPIDAISLEKSDYSTNDNASDDE